MQNCLLAVIAFAASAVSVSAAVFTSADGSSNKEVPAQQNLRHSGPSSTVGSFASLSRHLVAEVSSYLNPSSLDSLRATDKKLSRFIHRGLMSLNPEYSLKYINNEKNFRTEVDNFVAVHGTPIQLNLNPKDSLKYIKNENNFRSEANNKCSDLKSRIRLNLGGPFEAYIVNLVFRQHVDSLVEDPVRQIWSDVSSLFVYGAQVTNIEPIARLTNLQVLFLFPTQVSDLKPLAGLANLRKLYLSDMQVNIKPLAGLANLQVLSLYGTQFEDVHDDFMSTMIISDIREKKNSTW